MIRINNSFIIPENPDSIEFVTEAKSKFFCWNRNVMIRVSFDKGARWHFVAEVKDNPKKIKKVINTLMEFIEYRKLKFYSTTGAKSDDKFRKRVLVLDEIAMQDKYPALRKMWDEYEVCRKLCADEKPHDRTKTTGV